MRGAPHRRSTGESGYNAHQARLHHAARRPHGHLQVGGVHPRQRLCLHVQRHQQPNHAHDGAVHVQERCAASPTPTPLRVSPPGPSSTRRHTSRAALCGWVVTPARHDTKGLCRLGAASGEGTHRPRARGWWRRRTRRRPGPCRPPPPATRMRRRQRRTRWAAVCCCPGAQGMARTPSRCAKPHTTPRVIRDGWTEPILCRVQAVATKRRESSSAQSESGMLAHERLGTHLGPMGDTWPMSRCAGLEPSSRCRMGLLPDAGLVDCGSAHRRTHAHMSVRGQWTVPHGRSVPPQPAAHPC